VIVSLVSTGSAAAIALAIRRFLNYGPLSKGKVEVEGGLPDDGGFLDEAEGEQDGDHDPRSS